MVTNLQHKMTRTTTDEKKERTPNSAFTQMGLIAALQLHLFFLLQF
jgi:hypothetical protein